MGRDGPPGEQQPGGDLGVGQSLLHERGDLDLGRREAVPAAARLPVLGVRPAPYAVGPERSLQPGNVRGRAQQVVDLHGIGEGGPGLATIAGLDEVPGGRLQRLGPQQRAAAGLIALGGREQPGGVMVQQATAVQRVGLPVRDLRFGGERDGLAREGPRRV